MSGLLAAIGGLATIIGAVYGIFKYITWHATTTPAQTDRDIDVQEEKNKQQAEETGRPT